MNCLGWNIKVDTHAILVSWTLSNLAWMFRMSKIESTKNLRQQEEVIQQSLHLHTFNTAHHFGYHKNFCDPSLNSRSNWIPMYSHDIQMSRVLKSKSSSKLFYLDSSPFQANEFIYTHEWTKGWDKSLYVQKHDDISSTDSLFFHSKKGSSL